MIRRDSQRMEKRLVAVCDKAPFHLILADPTEEGIDFDTGGILGTGGHVFVHKPRQVVPKNLRCPKRKALFEFFVELGGSHRFNFFDYLAEISRHNYLHNWLLQAKTRVLLAILCGTFVQK